MAGGQVPGGQLPSEGRDAGLLQPKTVLVLPEPGYDAQKSLHSEATPRCSWRDIFNGIAGCSLKMSLSRYSILTGIF